MACDDWNSFGLQVNNWNTNRQYQEKISILLQGLKEDIVSDIAQLEKTYEVNEFRYNFFRYLLKLAGQTTIYNDIINKSENSSIWKNVYPTSYDREFIETSFFYIPIGFEPLDNSYPAFNELNPEYALENLLRLETPAKYGVSLSFVLCLPNRQINCRFPIYFSFNAKIRSANDLQSFTIAVL